jgi:tRNA-2-methylthio-N6-dimethylallyladenosine synthase
VSRQTEGKRVYIETYGCQMNVYDSRAIRDALRGAGWREVEHPRDANLLLLNTCAIREGAETRVLGRIGELQQYKYVDPALKIGITGCMAQRLGPQLHAQRKAVDLVVGTDNYGRLPELLEAVERTGQPQFDLSVDGGVTYEAEPEIDPLNNSHFISITQGCDYRCTFCVVPATRGVLRHKHPDVVLEEVRKVVGVGGVEVTLLGQNVTAYRHPEASFAELISRIARTDGIRRVRFLTSHPTDFPEATLQAVANHEEIAPWLHMPIQSGSDRILRRMKRGHRLQEYLDVVDRARELLGDVSFSTDIIVGFPGETDDDFRATLAVMERVGYDSAFMFKYSERPDTPASRLIDDVTGAVKDERLQQVIRRQDELWRARAGRLVGEEWTIAIEGPDIKGRGFLRGRTLNNRKVLVPQRPELGVGDELLVRITGIDGTTFSGEPVALTWKYQRVAA